MLSKRDNQLSEESGAILRQKLEAAGWSEEDRDSGFGYAAALLLLAVGIGLPIFNSKFPVLLRALADSLEYMIVSRKTPTAKVGQA